MSTQIAIRLPDEIVEFVDAQVSSGAAKSRADFIGLAIKHEQRRRTAERDLQIIRAAPYDEFEEMHHHVTRGGNPDLD